VTNQVRPAAQADVRELSATLGRAFFDDPVAMWMLPGENTRTARLGKFFATMTRHHHLTGGGVEVAVAETTAGTKISAAALWDPPDRWQHSVGEQLRMLPSFLVGFGLRLAIGRKLTELLELMKRQHPEEPHWYLATIGSDPSVRGRGFGQALMRSRLSRCDAEHAPAYLESSKPENIPYYQRFGFTVTGEIKIPGGPTLWPMWRAPRSGSFSD
jgi:ribosomal protein S18 acetylase RimI-like enzyme